MEIFSSVYRRKNILILNLEWLWRIRKATLENAHFDSNPRRAQTCRIILTMSNLYNGLKRGKMKELLSKSVVLAMPLPQSLPFTDPFSLPDSRVIIIMATILIITITFTIKIIMIITISTVSRLSLSPWQIHFHYKTAEAWQTEPGSFFIQTYLSQALSIFIKSLILKYTGIRRLNVKSDVLYSYVAN